MARVPCVCAANLWCGCARMARRLSSRSAKQSVEFRLMVDPESFFITDHYRNYPAVLVRLAQIDPDDLSDVIEQSWRWLAPRRLVAEYERTHPGQPISPLRDEEG